jgi:hypothetical protein
MKQLSVLFLMTFFLACSSADVPDRRDRELASDGESRMRADQSATQQILPPTNWWHNERLANEIEVTADQVRALDNAVAGQMQEMARLETDARDAMRELRAKLEADDAITSDIAAAGQRLRDARNALLDRQIAMVAAERQVVTAKQWKALDAALQEQRSRRGRDDNFRGRRGNRGGYPGGYPGGGRRNPWGW